MSRADLPTSKAFRRRVIGLSYLHSIPGVMIVIAYLWALLDLRSEQWSWFLWVTLAWGSLVSPPMMRWQSRIATIDGAGEPLPRRSRGGSTSVRPATPLPGSSTCRGASLSSWPSAGWPRRRS